MPKKPKKPDNDDKVKKKVEPKVDPPLEIILNEQQEEIPNN
jgi:hypothetical protein